MRLLLLQLFPASFGHQQDRKSADQEERRSQSQRRPDASARGKHADCRWRQGAEPASRIVGEPLETSSDRRRKKFCQHRAEQAEIPMPEKAKERSKSHQSRGVSRHSPVYGDQYRGPNKLDEEGLLAPKTVRHEAERGVSKDRANLHRHYPAC